MKCKECGRELDERKKIISGNPSFFIKCSCGAVNHVKCRRKNGVRKTTKIAQPSSLKDIKVFK